MLAATSGSLRRGRVVLYRYDFENNFLTFTPSREVNVGFGAYDVVADQARRRLFVSSPLSGHVAVIGGDPAQVIRYIPTGAGAYDMALGGNTLWTINAEDRTLCAIDLVTLKVKRTVNLPGVDRPLSVHWVSGEGGQSYVLVGGGRNGKLLVLDAQGLLAGDGDAALERVFNLGESLIQIASYEDNLWISDGKKRRLYKASVQDVITGDNPEGDPEIFTSVEEIPFTTTDILPTVSGLWVATGDTLSLIDNDGFIEGYERTAERLIEPNSLVIGGLGITVSNGLRIDNFRLNDESDLEEVVGIEGSRVQKLTTFVQYSE